MEARREFRFEIYGPVKATLLSRPERQLDCLLLDISATGLKLIAPENFPVDDIIAIEAEDHLALADVRYSQPRGDRFTIGGERIHLLQKVSLPKNQAKIDAIQLLIGDYRNRLRAGITTPRPDADEEEIARLDAQLFGQSATDAALPPQKPGGADQAPPDSAQCTTRDQLLDAAAAWVVEKWDKLPAAPHDVPGGRSEIIDRLTALLAERLRPQMPPSPPAPAQVFTPVTPVEPAQSQPAAVNKTPVAKMKARSWRLPLGVAATAVLGWSLSALFWSYGASGAASHLPQSIAALISTKPSAPASPTAQAAGQRHAQIKALEATWVVASSDGKRLFSKKLAKDDVRDIEFSDKVLLHIGNARGVEISLDGKAIVPMGGRGQTRDVELSATGVRFLPVN